MSRTDDKHALALALAEGEARVLAAIREAFRWGHERGYHAGFHRSFDEAPYRYSAAPRPLPSTAPRSIANGDERDDYEGGRVPEW